MLKSDRWIRKMSQEHEMINPFSEKQVREGVISYGLSSYGYDLRVADEFKIFTNVNCTVVDPKNFDERSFVTVRSDCCIVPPELVRPGTLGGIFQDPARRPDDLRRQVYIRALRNHRQRNPIRTGMGGIRDAGNLEHNAATCENLRQRRPVPDHHFFRVTKSAKSATQTEKASTNHKRE
jgi:hypothetical protein